MLTDVAVLAGSLVLILLSCVLFVNGVEHLAKRLGLHQGIAGSVLAAIGTALPETIIPIIAILFTKTPSAHDIGIGAIAGAPFMLGTLAFFVTGTAVLVYAMFKKRTIHMDADAGCISRDLTFFLIYYGVAVATTLVHEMVVIKAIIAVLLLLSYGLYLKWTFASKVADVSVDDSLYVSHIPGTSNNVFWIVIQLLFSLVLLVAGTHFFIGGIQAISSSLGVSALILSLIVTPIATELPEKFNSVIWVGKGKDTLALGNITGAMVFQSCFPVVIGMLFTDWHLKDATVLSAALALISAAIMLAWLRTKKSINPYVLLAGGPLYLVFIVYIFIHG